MAISLLIIIYQPIRYRESIEDLRVSKSGEKELLDAAWNLAFIILAAIVSLTVTCHSDNTGH